MCDYGLDVVKPFGISLDVDERMIMLQNGFRHTGNTSVLSFTPTTPHSPFPEPLNPPWLLSRLEIPHQTVSCFDC